MSGKQYTLEFNYVDEVYVDVVGFEGLYKVSNYGNVLGIRGKILKPDIDKDGYKIFTLYKNQKPKKIKGHRLVFYTFNPNADTSLQINHLDNVKNNNKIWNLEAVNHRENSMYKFVGKKTSSKYRGVTRAVRDNVWRAQIQVNKVKKHLGHFKTEEEAYEAYLKALKQANLTNKYA